MLSPDGFSKAKPSKAGAAWLSLVVQSKAMFSKAGKAQHSKSWLGPARPSKAGKALLSEVESGAVRNSKAVTSVAKQSRHGGPWLGADKHGPVLLSKAGKAERSRAMPTAAKFSPAKQAQMSVAETSKAQMRNALPCRQSKAEQSPDLRSTVLAEQSNAGVAQRSIVMKSRAKRS